MPAGNSPPCRPWAKEPLADTSDGASAQVQYCEAGASLRESVASLTSLDLVAEGTSGLETAIDSVKGDLGQLRDAAGESSATEVDAFEGSVDELEGAFSDLGGDISVENASAVAAAVQSVASSAQAVYETLSDC